MNSFKWLCSMASVLNSASARFVSREYEGMCPAAHPRAHRRSALHLISRLSTICPTQGCNIPAALGQRGPHCTLGLTTRTIFGARGPLLGPPDMPCAMGAHATAVVPPPPTRQPICRCRLMKSMGSPGWSSLVVRPRAAQYNYSLARGWIPRWSDLNLIQNGSSGDLN